MKVTFKEIAEIITSHTDFCIYTHISPDGDAVASSIGLALALRNLEKRVAVRCQDEFPKKFSDAFCTFVSDDVKNEVGISLDAASLQRLGVYGDANITVCIDHHGSNNCEIEYTYLDAESVSCSCIIYRLLEYMNVEISDRVRQLLFMGLLTDSDCFRSPEVSHRVFKDAADITKGMASPAQIIKHYCTSKSKAELECEKSMLSSLIYLCNNRLALAIVPNEHLVALGKGGTSSLSSIPARIEGVELGVSLFEVNKDTYNISIRSNGLWDASLLSTTFGGGGHKSSAGGRSVGLSKEDLISLIASRAEEIYCK